MMARRALAAACALGVVSLAGRPARAQASEAEELFQQGRKALETKDYGTACTKLQASEQLERAVGTLMSLATCEEAVGRLSSARLHWQEAAAWAEATRDQLNRAPLARKRFAALDLRVPRLTLKLASGAPKESTARRDDVDLGASAFDTAFPVDVGNHAVVVTAPGRQEGRFTVELGEGESKTLEVAPGEPVPAVKAAPPAPVAAPPPTVAPGETGTKHGSQTTIALIAGGAGVVSVVAGAVLGARAGSSWSSAQRDCTPNDCGAGSNAQREKSDADTAATLSTITVAAGAALIAGAAVLYFLPGGTKASAANASRPRLVPVAGVRGGGLFFTGAF